MRYGVLVEVCDETDTVVAWADTDVEADSPEDALAKAEITLHNVEF